jgi:hypothetical protein
MGGRIIRDGANAAEGNALGPASSGNDGGFHVHGNRMVISSETLLFLGRANRRGHCKQPSVWPVGCLGTAGSVRGPKLPVPVDHLAGNDDITDFQIRV